MSDVSTPVVSRDLAPGALWSADALPRPLSSFVGRADDLAALTALVTDPAIRLITILGPGGIGKTRLAIQVSHQVKDRFTDGVVFIGLANIRDPSLLPLAIANALGVTDLAERSWLERLGQDHRPSSILLVLDNLEHILDATPILAEVLKHAPGITMLGTSRTRLNLSGERTFSVPPLAEPDAIVLFEQRAHALIPGFAIQPDSSADIVDICRQLDGLPLAIELAAARTPVLPPNAMRARLDNRMTLLASGPRDAPARHRGMREAIAWSYDLLNRVDQVLFRRLAVFDGGFTLDAAAAVTGMTIDILDGITSLEASNLVKARPTGNGQARFVMLETIREFASERLDESREGETLRRAHADYFVQLGAGTERAFWGPDGQERVDAMEAEFANFRAALTWLRQVDDVDAVLNLAGSIAPIWARRGYSREGRAWLEWGLPHTGNYTTPAAILATRALSWILLRLGDYFRSLLLAQQVYTLSYPSGDPLNIVNSLILSGIASQRMGHSEVAITMLNAALGEIESVTGEPWSTLARGIALGQLGVTALNMGDVDLAERWLSQGDYATTQLGSVYRARGEPTLALEYYRVEFRDAVDSYDIHTIASLLCEMAGSFAALGYHERAARLFGASEAIHEHIALPFLTWSFELQRALGLPEPWANSGTPHGVSEPLYLALESQTAAIRSVEIDPDLAREWWDEGRRLPVSEAIDLAMSAIPSADPVGAEHPGGLTEREAEVLRLLVEGHSNQDIGKILSISTRTVENHVRSILAKLDLHSRTAAAAYAIRNGLA